jgi:hypothetical protein
MKESLIATRDVIIFLFSTSVKICLYLETSLFSFLFLSVFSSENSSMHEPKEKTNNFSQHRHTPARILNPELLDTYRSDEHYTLTYCDSSIVSLVNCQWLQRN